jgi:ATP-binding cassette subfamily B protein
MGSSSSRRRWLAPEVVQTSAMDCGPAALKCLLEGYGVPISYGRLREACQTDVDGTSIDTLEEVAGQLSLDAEQVMLPVDHLLLPEADALPALVVVQMPNGLTHFVVVWRRHGPYVQIMDPAVGRRWAHARRFLDEVYTHTIPVPREQWHAWACSDGFCQPLARRLASCGVGAGGAARIEQAVASTDWHALATLDAATRLVESLVRSGAVQRGAEAGRVLGALLDEGSAEASGEHAGIPDAYWSALPADPTAEGEAQVQMRGAVLLRVQGR